jgi:hypothetical protein
MDFAKASSIVLVLNEMVLDTHAVKRLICPNGILADLPSSIRICAANTREP